MVGYEDSPTPLNMNDKEVNTHILRNVFQLLHEGGNCLVNTPRDLNGISPGSDHLQHILPFSVQVRGTCH